MRQITVVVPDEARVQHRQEGREGHGNEQRAK
jgi:hypothetical protein